MKNKKIPESTIKRLSIYLREIKNLSTLHVKFISSMELACQLGFSDAQIRKDLSYFGQFGRIGVGYSIEELKSVLEDLLGVSKNVWKVAIAGAGKLGSALASYSGFSNRGFRIEACFDNDKKKVGTYLGKIKVEDAGRIKEIIKKNRIKIGIIAVPKEYAQKVAQDFVRSGVKSILNFAPVKVNVGKNVRIRDVDLSTELEGLSFYMSHQ